MPLIVKGARQIGKTASIMQFANDNYMNVVAINFVLQQEFKSIFDDGYDVDSVVRNITLINPSIELEPGNTIFFFDEMQDCPVCATSLKAFKIDGRYDVVCSGSLMGINYQEIESNSVGYKEDYTMHSMDFEEFLLYKNSDFLITNKRLKLFFLKKVSFCAFLRHCIAITTYLYRRIKTTNIFNYEKIIYSPFDCGCCGRY